jgi:hypothetical protein
MRCMHHTSASAFLLLLCSRFSACKKISIAAFRSATSCPALASFSLLAGSVVSAQRAAHDRDRSPQRAAGLNIAASSPMIAQACEKSSKGVSSTAREVKAVPAAGSNGTGVPTHNKIHFSNLSSNLPCSGVAFYLASFAALQCVQLLTRLTYLRFQS